VTRATRLTGAVLALAVLGQSGCARLFTPRAARGAAPSKDAIVATLAARERTLPGLRLSMSARATGVAGWLLASPTYLAIDDPEHLHLQVLAPFGATVFDLVTAGDDYQARWPMRGAERRGRIDPASLGSPETPADERLIVALALLFRPKTDPGPCTAAGAGMVRCPVAKDVLVTVRVDGLGRPVEEWYALAGAQQPLWRVEYGDYPGTDPEALPGTITVRDPTSEGAMVIRVLKILPRARAA
jgi:hypothetical protein